MEVIKTQNGTELTMKLIGRLDTNASPAVKDEMDTALDEGVESFILDLEECDYVASSGLRAILSAQKKMNALQGTMVVKNVISDVMEVFEMTGFSDILTFEE